MHSRAGGTWFSDVAVGVHFFHVGSTVPFLKASETHAIEGGSAVHVTVLPEERVVPILSLPGRVVIGYYSIPFGPVLESTGYEG